MMSYLMMMVFMIPLIFYSSMYWLNQFYYLMMLIMFMLNYKYFLLMNISNLFGCDLLSYLMILLSFLIIFLMLMSSMLIYYKNMFYKYMLLMIMLLMSFLYILFFSYKMILFYIFFEMSLIPTLILIIGWGYQPERLQSGVYLLLYTLIGSFPLLSFILNYYSLSMMMSFIKLMYMDNIIYYFMMVLVFLIKLPMYMVHLWLPKAHVEAPISGSMILAGVLLKLGGVGLIRFLPIFYKVNINYNFILIIFSLLGGSYISMLCFRQVDMKSLIAYSSVSHMSLVLGSLLIFSSWSLLGALIMMLAHGLCSSGLFCLVNISYERSMSRSLFLNKGLINIIPSMSLWWFLLCSLSMSAPPSLNLLSEIMIINSLISWNKICMIFVLIMSFFSAVYSLYLYSYSQHGKLYSGGYSFFLINMREYMLLFMHWFPLNLMVLKSNLFY
uniref:NADH-ubiquinone oxidoreductase chain 4 n=1 Tax=Scydmaeninae sp. BMNH 1274313 TaxID=1796549 RepID=A0A126TFA2_9COLE|nr:NADH dehydrogenase subunit 4 [Scydmaeninae sp. BMNH 1274313]